MKYFFLIFFLFSAVGCQKFLNKPADASTQIPTTVTGFQQLMDQAVLTSQSTPGLGPMYMTDYYVSSDTVIGTNSFLLGFYTWQPELIESGILQSWSNPYRAIYVCNTVLMELPKLRGLDSADKAESNFVMGQAYFLRGLLYFNLEETFGQPYRPGSSETDAGVPLRLDENVMADPSRAKVAEVYKQIVADLSAAVALLPAALQTANRNRPCASAAYGLLARVGLTQQNYSLGEQYATSGLLLYDSLLDFNTVDSSSLHPFPAGGNCEVLFQNSAFNYPLQYGRTILVDSMLYRSYGVNDLRRVVYFQPASGTETSMLLSPRVAEPGGASNAGFFFKGQYTGLVYVFSGVAVDEVFFIRAECRARSGDIAGAMFDLNTVLSKRWRQGTFQPFVATTQDEAIRIILREKHMETVFREGPFYDLRRVNQDQAYADTLGRVYNGIPYSLLPMNPRYAFPIPVQEITQSGLMQNPE